MSVNTHLEMVPRNLQGFMRLQGRVGQGVRQVVRNWTVEAAKAAKRNAQAGRPFLHRRTGGLVSKIKPLYRITGLRIDAGVEFPAIPGLAHNDGAVIRPKRGKYLLFRLYANDTEAVPTGPWRRARVVRLRGTKWATKAIQETGKKVPALIQQEVMKAWREASARA